MNMLVETLAPWLADYFLLSTLLLGVVLLACWRIEQPARRQALARPTLIALFLLAGLCALPGWSLVHLLTQAERDSPTQTNDESIAIPVEEQQTTRQAETDMEVPPLPQFPAAEVELLEPTPRPSKPVPWTTWLVIAYLSGSLLTTLWQASGGVLARRLVRQATPASAELQRLLADVREDDKRLPSLFVSDRLQAPAALGVFHPKILLPQDKAPPPQSTGEGLGEGNCGTDTLRPILAHELAHIRHGDLQTLTAARLLAILLWPQPLFWLLRRRVRLDQETLADAAATEVTNCNEYAEQLVAWARSACGARVPRLASSVGLWESASELKERVATLLDERFSIVRSCSLRWRVGSLVVLMCFALALSVVSIWPSQLLEAIENEAKETNSIASKEFSFGSKVEVLAIGTHDEEPQRWWDVAGKRIDSVPFDWKKVGNVSGPDSLWRRVVIRVTHLPDDAGVSWKLDSSWASGKVTIDGEQEPEGYLTRYFAISENQETFGFRFGIAAGPWKTRVKNGPSNSGSMGQRNDDGNVSGIIFSKAAETVEGTIVVVSHNYSEHDVRVAAIDKQGNLHESEGQGGAGAAGFTQMRRAFPALLLGDIDRFEFQVRDYEWVEFKYLPTGVEAKGGAQESETTSSTEGESKSQEAAQAVEKSRTMLPFGDVIETLVYDDVPGYEFLIDFDNAETKSLPQEPESMNNKEVLQWCTANGIDALGEGDMLLGIDMIVLPTAQSNWNPTPRIFNQIEEGKPGAPVPISGQGELPATYFFKTREGGRGVLQITEIVPSEGDDKPRATRIRYKLLRQEDDSEADKSIDQNVNKNPTLPLAVKGLSIAVQEDEPRDTEALKELVKSYEQIYKRIEAIHKVGGQGGETAKLALAKFYLLMARGELAETQGDLEEARMHYERAVEVSQDQVDAVQAVYDVGNTTLESVLEVNARRAKAKQTLGRLLNSKKD